MPPSLDDRSERCADVAELPLGDHATEDFLEALVLESRELQFIEALETYLRARGNISVAPVVEAFRNAVRAVE